MSVLRVGWTPSLPYYAIRDHEGVLDARLVYTRRGGTVGILRPPEVEALFRQKEARIWMPPDERQVDVGFVENGFSHYNSIVVARIVNLTDEPVTGLTTLWDVRLPAWPSMYSRFRSFSNTRLEPGETKEDDIDPTRQYFASPEEKRPNVSAGIEVGTRWFDITLRVQFRDREGFFQQIERRLSIGG